MFDWLWSHAESVGALSAAAGVIIPAAWAFYRWARKRVAMWLGNRAQVAKMVQSMAALHEVLIPPEGALGPDGKPLLSLRNIIANLQQAQENLSEISLRNGRRLASVVARDLERNAEDPNPVFETDELGEVTSVNPAFIRLTGRSPQELLGSGWEIILTPETRAFVSGEIDAARDGRRGYDGRFEVIDADGHVVRVRCVIRPLICEMKVLVGYKGRLYRLDQKGN